MSSSTAPKPSTFSLTFPCFGGAGANRALEGILLRLQAPVAGAVVQSALHKMFITRWIRQAVWFHDIDLKQGICAPTDGVIQWYHDFGSENFKKMEISFTIVTPDPAYSIHCGILVEKVDPPVDEKAGPPLFQNLDPYFRPLVSSKDKVSAGSLILRYEPKSRTPQRGYKAYIAVSEAPGQIIMRKKCPDNTSTYINIGANIADVYKSDDARLLTFTADNKKDLHNADLESDSDDDSDKTA